MLREHKTTIPAPNLHPRNPATPLLAGALLGLATFAAWSAWRARHRYARRYADQAVERRAPLSLFTAGDHPRRRRIDRSGAHPLFERRQSVYDSY